MSAPSDPLQEALRLHQSGQLKRAEEIYRQILASNPDDADALHLLGVTELQAGQHQLAVDHICRAIGVKATQADYHHHLGQAYQALGRSVNARASFVQALKLNPALAASHYHLGLVEHNASDWAAAAQHYERALRLRPEMVEAHVNLGDVLRAQGKLDEAATEYRAAVRLRPECVEALHNLGAALVELERFQEAADCLQELVSRQPELAEGHYNLGRAWKGLGRSSEAQSQFQEALQVRPDFAIAHYAIANMLHEQGDLQAASEAYCRALVLDPNDPDTLTNYGKVLQKQGKHAEALDNYNRAIELKPDLAVAHFSRAMILLRDANFAVGWKDYEWRVKLPNFPLEVREESLWDGSNLRGQTLLVHAEQGLGDTLQFIRFVPLLKALAPDVIVRVQTPLVPLLRESGFCVFGDDDPLPNFDWQVPLLSLPRILGTNLSNIPSDVPYLLADRALAARWRERLRIIGGFKVGIAWQGNPNHVADRQRSIPLASFAPLAQVPSVNLVSLQKDAGPDQIAKCAEVVPVETLDGLDEHGGAFMDSAAVMTNLDLVVTSDTAVAHLAGALGVSVWVALPAAADWRWLANRDDSPWYPTMRLFRQSTPGDWAVVFERIATEVAGVIGQTAPHR